MAFHPEALKSEEHRKRHPLGRIPVLEDGDVINVDQPLSYFENNWDDDAKYSESISFRSDYDINGVKIIFPPFNPPYHLGQYLETYFLYEYPKAEDIAEDQKQYIQNYIRDFENSLFNIDNTASDRDYNNYIDIDSFVDYFILNELTGNICLLYTSPSPRDS